MLVVVTVRALKKRDRHIVPGQTMMESFNAYESIIFSRGKNEPVPGRERLPRNQSRFCSALFVDATPIVIDFRPYHVVTWRYFVWGLVVARAAGKCRPVLPDAPPE